MKWPVVLVASREDWPDRAREEASRLRAALGEDAPLVVHHIGSTAVPGLIAKPVIDVIAEMDDLTLVDAARASLERAGYAFLGESGIAGRRFLQRHAATERLAHVHCFARGDASIERHLALRDYLRAHVDVAARYSDEKRRCADAHPDDSSAYSDAKSAFVTELEVIALAWSRSRARG